MINEKYIGEVVSFHGVRCVVDHRINEKTYRLVVMDNAPVEMLKEDPSFTESHCWGASAQPIECPLCHSTIWIDESNMPNGIKYEVKCACGCMMMRKVNRDERDVCNK